MPSLRMAQEAAGGGWGSERVLAAAPHGTFATERENFRLGWIAAYIVENEETHSEAHACSPFMAVQYRAVFTLDKIY